MPKTYKVNKTPELFIDQYMKGSVEGGYISYRMVMCHAIHAYIHNIAIDIPEKEKSKESIKQNIKELLGMEKDEFEKTHFLQSYPLNTSHGKRVLIIDKTDGCYPLVLYGDDKQDAPKDFRISEFKKSLKALYQHFDLIYSQILNSQTFDEELHKKLKESFGNGKC